MKHFLSAVLIVALTLPGAVQAAPQKLPAPLIAVMDVQGIIQNSMAAKSVRPQARKMRNEFQKDVRRQQDEIRKEEKLLAQQRSILSPEAFAKKRRDFETRARKAQRDVQARKLKLDKAFGAAMEQVRHALAIVAQELAKEYKVNIVLPKSLVFLSIKTLDISAQAIQRLDKRLPSVKVIVTEKK